MCAVYLRPPLRSVADPGFAKGGGGPRAEPRWGSAPEAESFLYIFIQKVAKSQGFTGR